LSSLSPPGNYVGSIAEIPKQIFTTLSESGRSALFQNPIADAIGGLSNNTDRLLNAYKNSPCFGESGGPSAEVISGIGDLSSSIESFTLHTNTLSGLVAQTANNPTASLERVLSVGQAVNNLNYAITGAESCANFLNGMTGLFSGELLNGYTSQLASLINRVNQCLASASEILSIVNQMKDNITAIIDADNNFFANALETLRRNALANIVSSIYNNPCGKYLMENKIAGPQLMKILSGR
jgi:hypothetical protein